MTNKMRKIFKEFMKTRFPNDEEGSSYWESWEKRFERGEEWQQSDYSNRAAMKLIAPDVYPDDKDEFFLRD